MFSWLKDAFSEPPEPKRTLEDILKDAAKYEIGSSIEKVLDDYVENKLKEENPSMTFRRSDTVESLHEYIKNKEEDAFQRGFKLGASTASTENDSVNCIKHAVRLIKTFEEKQITDVIGNDTDDTAALLLGLEASAAATVFQNYSITEQTKIILSMMSFKDGKSSIHQKIQRALIHSLNFEKDLEDFHSVKVVASIMNQCDRHTFDSIRGILETSAPEIWKEIQSECFVFEDISSLPDQGIREMLKLVDNEELAVALKAATEELKEKIFKNVSERAAEMIQDEMEFMGPVRVADVEAAQARIVDAVTRLEKEGVLDMFIRNSNEEVV